MKNADDINGVVILNKPTGMSSMTAVKRVQYALNAKKAGHLGTLDPYATGVLAIALGKATKLFESHLNQIKVYRAAIKFGFETDTLDSEGKVAKTEETDISETLIVNVLKKFIGKQFQMPPVYSAKKIQGKKAYQMARKGENVTLQAKEIEIFDLKLIQELEKNTFLFEISCSAGTYIRSFARDLAKELGTVAVMVALIRLKSGQFELCDSAVIETLNKNDIILRENY